MLQLCLEIGSSECVTGEKGQGRGKGEKMDKGGKYWGKGKDKEILG